VKGFEDETTGRVQLGNCDDAKLTGFESLPFPPPMIVVRAEADFSKTIFPVGILRRRSIQAYQYLKRER
jgi:hypothetical protein